MSLRLASFGMRGLVGDSLTPRAVMDFSSAFGTFLEGGRILVGRDTRYSSPMLHSAVLSSLTACGCEVLDLGICPTPMIQYCVGHFEAAGAVSISGGHHGMGWNALTLIGSDGALLDPVGGETVLDIYHGNAFDFREAYDMGSARDAVDFADVYFAGLREAVAADAIRAKNFTVLIDPLCGAGCPYLDMFARELGFRLIGINDQPSGYLPREAEPRPRSALQMASFIKHMQGDAGFVLSSDMGRLSLVTEQGEPVSEEITFALVARHILNKKPGLVVTNCCSSRRIDDIARERECPVIKTQVGQAYVVSAVEDEGAVVGGEGSGSAVVPSFSRAFDGFLMMGLVLEAMTKQGKTLSGLIRELPRYHIVKRRLSSEAKRAYQVLDDVKDQIERLRDGGTVDETDGIRIDWENGWLHIRASHTEQIIRIISEDRDKTTAEARAEKAIRMIGQRVGA